MDLNMILITVCIYFVKICVVQICETIQVVYYKKVK